MSSSRVCIITDVRTVQPVDMSARINIELNKIYKQPYEKVLLHMNACELLVLPGRRGR